jgi:esterase/lipase
MVMLVGVLAILVCIYETIDSDSKLVIHIQEKNYEQYKKERDEDFKAFTDKSIGLLSSNLDQIRQRLDMIQNKLEMELSKQDQKVEKSVQTIDAAAKSVQKRYGPKTKAKHW